MKNREQSIILLAKLLLALALMPGGIALALEATQTVTVTASVPELLSFTAGDIAGNQALSSSSQVAGGDVSLGSISWDRPASVVRSARLFSTGDWMINGPSEPIYMSDGTHKLQAPLETSISPAGGTPGEATVTTSYTQVLTPGDYAGSYSVPVVWIINAIF
jgi:hypothetical protein